MGLFHAIILPINQRPSANCCFFCLFQCFAEKEYQTEYKQKETFARIFLVTNGTQETWSGSQGSNEAATRQEGAPPTLVAPSLLHRPTSFAYIYSYTLKTSRRATKPLFHCRNLLYPWDPLLGRFPTICRRGIRSWRASTSTPLPLRLSVSSLPQIFGSIVIS